jgi:tetratricopeptide (TPR) repeat protein
MQLRVDPSNEWETLIRAGCFSCLRDALARIDGAAVLQSSPDLARTAFSTAALLVVRARELGLPEGHFMERARFWSDRLKPSARQVPPSAFFDALALIQGDTMGLPPSERERRAVEHRVRWTTDGSAPPARAALSPFVDDVVAEYVALTLDCENGKALTPWERDQVLARHPIPLIHFRLHVCAADEEGLRSLLETADRWVDTLAIRGRLAMVRYPSPNLVEAARLLGAAHREFGQSDSISLALAAAQNALSDHSSALTLFDEVLKNQPGHSDALLGRVLSLSYLKRHVDAVATATVLIDLGTEHVSDAWYWRAWNRYQLQQLPDAWRDVTHATSSSGNASAYLLAGVIAYARQWPFTAIDRLHTAYVMDSTQCEAVWIEALVHVDQEEWKIAGSRFAIAVDCFGDAADQAKRHLNAAQQAPYTDPKGDSRLESIATEQLASAQWRLAQSAYNAANSYARAGDQNIALRYLAIAARHPLMEKKSDELKRQMLRHEPAPR